MSASDNIPEPVRPAAHPAGIAWLPWLAAAGLGAAWLLPLSRAWKIAPDLGHAWIVPLLMAYLWWERWDERPPADPAVQVSGRLWLLAAAVIALQVGTRIFLTPFPVWPAVMTLYTGAIALVALVSAWLLGGRPALRWVAGPLILMLAALPVPTTVEMKLIGPLRELMASLVAELCNLLGRPAIASGTSVRLAQSWVGIDEACGGIRSLQACLMIALFFGEWYRFSVGRRLALVLAGCAAALGGNGGRVLFLSLRAGAGGDAVANAHDLAGWLAMLASLLVTGWLAWRWGGYRLPQQRRTARSVAVAGRSPAWRWSAVIVGCFMLTEAGVRLWFARGEAARRDVPQWVARLPVDRPSFRRESLSEPAREMLGPDEYIAGAWPLARDAYASAYYIEWHQGQTARTAPFLHNPTVCMPFSGCELVQTLPIIPVRWSGGEIPFFAHKFRRVGDHMLVAFTIWDPSRGRPLVATETETWSAWFAWRWNEVREARQHQPAQMLAVALPWDEEAPAQMQALLGSLITPVGAK